MRWRSDIPLAGFDPSPAGEQHGGRLGGASVMRAVDVYRVDRPADCPAPFADSPADRFAGRAGGRPINRGVVYPDGIRFGWGEAVVFDMIAGTDVAYRPGPIWTGVMPTSFYSTVAALTAAWRGMVPLHACAVKVDGKAILIAGAAGAGKSTLTAGMIALGADFIADDLVVVSIRRPGAGANAGVDAGAHGATNPGKGRIEVMRGRPTMRIHGGTGVGMDSISAVPIVGDPRGKWLVRPRGRSVDASLDLGAVLLLDRGADPGAMLRPEVATRQLFAHVFRRRWIDALPMRAAVLRDVLTIAASVPMLAYPALADFTATTAQRRAEDAMIAVRKSLAKD